MAAELLLPRPRSDRLARLDLVSKSVKISLPRASVQTVDNVGGDRLRARPHVRPRPHPTRQQLRIRYCFAPGRDAGAEPVSVGSGGTTSIAVAIFLPACASYEAFTLAPSWISASVA